MTTPRDPDRGTRPWAHPAEARDQHPHPRHSLQPILETAPIDDGLAIFDLDRTLIPGSSLVPFGNELVRRRLVRRRDVASHLAAAAAFRHRGLADRRVDRIRVSLLADLAGTEHQPLAEVARSVGVSLAASVYPTLRWLLDRHLEAGDFCVVLTAAPQELATALADAIGAHRAIGTRLEVVDGRFTGALDGAFCHGPGKLECLSRELGPCNLLTASAYGDSASDLALLERCRHPVAINPDRALRAVAERMRWPIVRCA